MAEDDGLTLLSDEQREWLRDYAGNIGDDDHAHENIVLVLRELAATKLQLAEATRDVMEIAAQIAEEWAQSTGSAPWCQVITANKIARAIRNKVADLALNGQAAVREEK